MQRLRDDLRMLVTAIRLARPEIDAADPPARAVKLAKLLDLFERRIDAMAEARASELPADAAPRARIALAETEPSRAQLFVLPMRNEPEAPPPTPASFEPPQPAPAKRQRRLPLPKPGRAGAAVAKPPTAEFIEAAAPPADPLAAIMALSADERLALFT